MNILLSNNWLKDYLETDADPYELQKFLSLCGPSVETVEKVGNDYVFDIEITSNRIDMASAFGIAQEATAILPQFGKKGTLKINPLEEYTFDSLKTVHEKSIDIEIKDPSLASRFTAIILKNIEVKQSPDFMRQRLNAIGANSINNVVDISNYLRLSLGQPVHMFDYDQIKNQKMVLRASEANETVKTLDGKEFALPGDDIIIEDGEGNLIDLCGIMGGENTEITEKTQTVLFLVPVYDKKRIRKTSMLTGQRSDSSTYFEKDLDPNRVESTLVYGVRLLQEYAGAEIASELYDMYGTRVEEKTITLSKDRIDALIGVEIETERITKILTSLGFGLTPTSLQEGTETKQSQPDALAFEITVPTYRNADVEIPEDIVEEIARVYGYFNLPNNLSPLAYVPPDPMLDKMYNISRKIKYLLKHLGFHEVINYSMISKNSIENLDLALDSHLRLNNTISTEIEYLRTTLMPSLVLDQAENEGKRESLRFFEIGKVYLPHDGQLPNEIQRLGISTNTDFFDLKAAIEAVCSELHVNNVTFVPGSHPPLVDGMQAALVDGESGDVIGYIGQLKHAYKQRFGLEENIFIAEIDLSYLVEHATTVPNYIPPSQYATVKLDQNISLESTNYSEIKSKAFKSSNLLKNMEVIDSFEGQITIRFYFNSSEKNLTEKEAKEELQKIMNNLS